ncbi:hypothetical protein FN846DRAFT_419658 [Sphaerosporella brunnea]|uniref:Uncharacterized protein n=1 Tax=Sphaerosporella brunnea TaxID=1250544 RepID=A0A5J5EG74_9PEZI|nr:hypothetical protein FN846DRAFT_419658 [Sphaerosporella brunnea]
MQRGDKIPTEAPFPRNNNFYGRANVFRSIDSIFWPPSQEPTPSPLSRKEIHLHGARGQGKSAIALEYVFRNDSQYSCIFWINAADEVEMKKSALATVKQIVQHLAATAATPDEPDYQKIATSLRVFDTVQTEAALIEAAEGTANDIVKLWLEEHANGRWLLIIENWDDPAVKIEDLLPAEDVGHVLITSHVGDAVGSRHAIQLEDLSEDENLQILVKSTGKDSLDALEEQEKEHARSVVRRLEGPPLFLELAGRRIGKAGSFGNYPTHLDDWKASFHELEDDAKKLMYLLASLAHEDIPVEMIRRGQEKLNLFRRDVKELFENIAATALLKKRSDGVSYSMPAEVHAWLHELRGRPNSGKAQNPRLATEMVVSTISPEGSEDWEYEHRILPHIHRCRCIFHEYLAFGEKVLDTETKRIAFDLARVYGHFADRPSVREALYKRALMDVRDDSEDPLDVELKEAFGKYLRLQSRLKEARAMYQQALDAKKKRFSDDHLHILETLHVLAVLDSEDGQYEKALEEHRRVLRIQEENDHPSALDTLERMAIVYKDQGKYEEALGLLDRVLAARKKDAADEPNTAILETIHQIGVVYFCQGKYKRAREEYENVLKGQEEILSNTPNHPSLLDTKHSIAEAYEYQGEYEKAKEVYFDVLNGCEEAFGFEHPWTLMTLNGIADIYESLGEYKEALEGYEKVHEGYQKLRVAGIRGLYNAENDIGRMLNKLGQYEQALVHHQNAGKAQAKELGENHPLTLTSTFGVATTYEYLGRYEEARQLFERVFEEEKQTLKLEHPSTLTTACSLASVLHKMGRYGDALKLYQMAVDDLEKIYEDDQDHPTTLTAVFGLANALQSQGHHEAALKHCERVIEGRKRKLSPQHPMTLMATYAKASVLGDKGNFEEAASLYENIAQELKATFGAEHPSTLTVLHAIGVIYTAKGEYDLALHYLRTARAGCEKALGEEHPLTLQVYCSIASVYNKHKRKYPYEALRLYDTVLDKLPIAQVGESNPILLVAMQGKADVLRKRKPIEAEELYQKVKVAREKQGELHPKIRLLDEEKLKKVRHRIKFGAFSGAITRFSRILKRSSSTRASLGRLSEYVKGEK